MQKWIEGQLEPYLVETENVCVWFSHDSISYFRNMGEETGVSLTIEIRTSAITPKNMDLVMEAYRKALSIKKLVEAASDTEWEDEE
jgi:hypothetical protein